MILSPLQEYAELVFLGDFVICAASSFPGRTANVKTSAVWRSVRLYAPAWQIHDFAPSSYDEFTFTKQFNIILNQVKIQVPFLIFKKPNRGLRWTKFPPQG
jgi:hypothetical protein